MLRRTASGCRVRCRRIWPRGWPAAASTSTRSSTPAVGSRRPRRWIVEGAGGVLVPLNESTLMVDLMARLALPVVVVARIGARHDQPHAADARSAARAARSRSPACVMVGAPNRREPRRDRAVRPRGRRRRAAAARPADAGRRSAAGRVASSIPADLLDCDGHDARDDARRPRSRRRLASLHADAHAARSAADRARRRRLSLHRGRPAAARRHLVVVGQHPRPLASALERGAGRAGARRSSTSSSPTARTRRRSSWPSGSSPCCRRA